MSNQVLIITRENNYYAERLEKLALPDLHIICPRNEAETLAGCKVANILIGTPPIAKNYLHLMPHLKWFQSTFAGIDALCQPDLRQDYTLTNMKDTYGPVMGEYVMGYILAHHKEILINWQAQQNKEWLHRPTSTIQDKTIGILGTGSIGKEIAKLAKVFGLNTLGYRSQNKPAEHFDQIYTPEQFVQFLSKSDYIINVLPATADTNNLFNGKAFAAMPNHALFINVGRGNSVNETDIVNALENGEIAGAVLDVFHEEPLPKSSPLWTTKNLLITAHVSGFIFTNRIIDIFASNYHKFINNEPLDYQIDFTKGY